MPTSRSLIVPVLALALVASAGCAGRDRTPGRDAYERGDFVTARAFFEKGIDEGDNAITLDRNEAGTVALTQGDMEASWRRENLPRVDAIAAVLRTRPRIEPVFARHFPDFKS